MWRGWACAGLQPQKMTRSARFLTSPRVQVGRPISCTAIRVVPWQTAAVLSQQAFEISAISLPTLWASQLVEDQPYIRGFFAFASIWAV